ncbi:hypothetical protein RIR_jg31359.t1 [Rhizophagus irregularis DAOM 181602=DAOM 197198]|nr:hypothetical protein RIR_jg31359.t1 [Rhizophagus irregularis DAOM 181602=DAOM 197198]
MMSKNKNKTKISRGLCFPQGRGLYFNVTENLVPEGRDGFLDLNKRMPNLKIAPTWAMPQLFIGRDLAT